MAFKATCIKVPAKKDEIFMKGLQKFAKHIVSGFSALSLTLGSFDSDSSNLSSGRQKMIYRNKLINYERMLSDLLWMFND